MAEEATVRVRLDTSEAQADLRALYGQFGNAPGVKASSTPAPGQGGGAQGPGGRGGSFGRNAAVTAAGMAATLTAAFGRQSIGTGFAFAAEITRPIGERVERFLFGDSNAMVKGGRNALEQVKGQLGLAVGFGADPEAFRGVFDVIKNIETRREQGRRDLEKAFGSDVANFDDLGGVAGDLVRWIKDNTTVLQMLSSLLGKIGIDAPVQVSTKKGNV